MSEKPVDPKPTGLADDRAELWYVCTGIVNSHETGDDLKQMALGIRQQLRFEARVNELTDMFYRVKSERDKLLSPPAPGPGFDAEGWRPIETAPKDGTTILAYRAGVLNLCRWYDDWMFGEGAWGSAGWSYSKNYGPTHWMPLPPAPNERNGE